MVVQLDHGMGIKIGGASFQLLRSLSLARFMVAWLGSSLFLVVGIRRSSLHSPIRSVSLAIRAGPSLL